MNLILISILAVASLSLLPTKTHGTTEVQEPPQALPLAAQTQPTNGGGGNAGINDGGEIWQEDDREVLIRNERGAKNNGNGSGSGKRGKNKKNKNHISTTKTPTAHEPERLEKKENEGKTESSKEKKQQTPQEQKQTQEQHQTHNKHSNKHNTRKSHSEDGPSDCRYVKSPWTECDFKSNMRSRTLTLKKGEPECVPIRTIQKKCKKACRYEKGTWSECITGQMSRTDKLKSSSDPTCQSTRVVNKNCNPGKSKDKSNKDRKNKDKGARKGRA